MPPPPRRARGFSLLEVLVAFVILSLSLGVIMRIFSAALNNIGKAEHHVHAAALAESVLAGLGVEAPLDEGELSGEDGQGYRWRAVITPYVDPDEVLASQANPLRLYQVDLEVAREDTDEDESGFNFTTLRAVPKP